MLVRNRHYIMNDQETNRGSVSEMVDERTRYQMYLPPFAGALDADVGSIMCSYNKINGQGNPTPIDGAKTGFKPGHWSCENPVTLKGDLKTNGAGGVRGKAWEGFVMSDWVSVRSQERLRIVLHLTVSEIAVTEGRGVFGA
jgi:beta-glucosidase